MIMTDNLKAKSDYDLDDVCLEQGFPAILTSGPLEAPILFSVDPTVQQYAIKVTKRGPSRSPVDLLGSKWTPVGNPSSV